MSFLHCRSSLTCVAKMIMVAKKVEYNEMKGNNKVIGAEFSSLTSELHVGLDDEKMIRVGIF